MRNRFFIVLLLAITTGGGLAYATYNFMNAQPAQTVVNAPTQPVVVAASDLSLGAEVKADDVRVLQFPKGQAPEGAFSRTDEVVGRGLIVNVVRNEPILGAKLASKEAGAGLPPIDSRGAARGVGPRQRGHRRRRLRAARHARRRARDREPDDADRRHDVEGRADQRPGARGRHARSNRTARTTSRCRSRS